MKHILQLIGTSVMARWSDSATYYVALTSKVAVITPLLNTDVFTNYRPISDIMAKIPKLVVVTGAPVVEHCLWEVSVRF